MYEVNVYLKNKNGQHVESQSYQQSYLSTHCRNFWQK
jgi:hypothetical protein